MTITIADAYTLFKSLPLLLEEFVEDSDIMASYTEDGKLVSPLLSYEKMLGGKSAVADMVVSNVPLYHVSSDEYSTTRDPSRLNIPRSMQTEFWATFFRDTLATEINRLLLDSYNKLRYPFLGEEHILNRVLLKKVNNFYPESSDFYLIEGKAVGPDLVSEGAIDSPTIDAIIDEKLQSIYTLCDYSPSYSNFIDDWLSSLYLSGQLSYEERIREENLYKVQDLKAELLRRKFAGSAALYNVVLSAINRRGTYASAVPLKSVETSAEFKDSRLIRALYLPGITVDTSRARTFHVDLLAAFGDKIPPRTLIPLYYSSGGRVGGYNSDAFDGMDENSQVFMDDYLRANSTTFAWDNLRGITDPSMLKDKYPRLDELGAYLDGYDAVGDAEADTKYLDAAEPMFDLSFVTTSFFDIQADRILYHRNSQQELLGQDYPYVTYTLANSNSLSMMDLPWLEYTSQVLADKTRVQESVNLGVQVSHLLTDSASTVRENFTVITFDSSINLNFAAQSSTYESYHRYAYLWNVSILYNFTTFAVESVTPRLITYVLLQVDPSTLSAETVEQNNQHPSWRSFTTTSVGLIPFVYGELSTRDILARQIALNDEDGLIDDLYAEEYGRALFLFTDKENVAIAKKYLATAAHDLVSSGDWSPRPSSDLALKHVIYGVERRVDDVSTEWAWSEPLRLYPMGSPSFWSELQSTSLLDFKPDWMGLVSYINPYLNFTAKSASPLRRRDVALRALRPATDINPVAETAPATWPQGPSPWCALSDLNLQRGYEAYINADGLTSNANYPRGTYFHRVRQQASVAGMEPSSFSLNEEKLQVWGDNRAFPGDGGYATDPADTWDADETRSEPYLDELGVYALLFKAGDQYSVTESLETYYTLQPAYDTATTSWEDWIWNNPDADEAVNGLTACVDCRIEDPAIPRALDEVSGSVNDFYLISQHGDDSKALNAAFDWYFTTEHTLVFDVYPRGTTSHKWSVSIDADHILDRQAQLAVSYKHFENADGHLCVEQSIVADRVWQAVCRVVVYDETTSTYSVYETDSSFDITGVTPTEDAVTVTSPYVGWVYGEIIRYTGEANNSLRDICVLNRDHGLGAFLGILYDFRLYRRGASLPETILLCSGTRRELYSYSPSLYKLAYQHFSDPGVLRRVNPVNADEARPKRLRVFNRSVWDSILIDLFPVSQEERTPDHVLYNEFYRDPHNDFDIYSAEDAEEGIVDYKLGVLEQRLVDNYEVMSEVNFPDSMRIFYRGQEVLLDNDDMLTFLQTTLYPINYAGERFASGAILRADPLESTTNILSLKAYSDPLLGTYLPAGAASAQIPSTPSGDTLVYKCDLDINFKLPYTTDATSPFDYGSNIRIGQTAGQDYYHVYHGNTSLAKSAEKNFLLLPLYLPSQGTNDNNPLWSASLHGITLQHVTVSSALATLLNSSSYYNEVQIPYPVKVGTQIKYTSRWDAIRNLREGSYFVTAKYPVQFRPFTNAATAANLDAATVYAATRFKVVARGEAQYYEEALMDPITGWEKDNLQGYLESRAYASPDNCSYPHRKIYIDLYVMKSNTWGVDWLWDKIASNYDEDVQLLGAELLSGGTPTLEAAIPAYFTPSYTAPFFVDGGVASTSTVTVKGGRSGNVEKVTATSTADAITLLSGRSYKMLFDFSANVTELAYNSVTFRTPEVSGIHMLSAEEILSYDQGTGLLGLTETERLLAEKEVFYTSTLNYSYYLRDDYDFSVARSGYVVQADGSFAAVNTSSVEDTCALGDPYSTAASKNLMVAKLTDYRADVASLGYFPYKQQQLLTDVVAPANMFSVDSKLPVVSKYGRNSEIFRPAQAINEYAVIQKKHTQNMTMIRERLLSMQQPTSIGVIKSFSAIEPLLSTLGSLFVDETITTTSHTLCAYNPQPFYTHFAREYRATETTMLRNNLIQHRDFSDDNYYTTTATSASFAYDAEEDADVYTMMAVGEASASLEYKAFACQPGKLFIRVKASESATMVVSVGATVLATEALDAGVWEDVEVAIAAASNESLLLAFNAGTTFTSCSIAVHSLALRASTQLTHYVGLSDVLLQSFNRAGSPRLLVQGRHATSNAATSYVAFKKVSTGQYFPLQFKNTGIGLATGREQIKTAFISNYAMVTNSSSAEIPLLRPWTRQLVFTESNPAQAALHKYAVSRSATSVAAVPVAMADSSIFSINNLAEDPDDRSIQFNSSTNSVEFGGTGGVRLNISEAETVLNSNLVVDTTNPAVVFNERFSLTANCVNPDSFAAGLPSTVVVTNFQVMNDDDDNPAILYELEYLPIIYDEAKHHLSVNFLVKSN